MLLDAAWLEWALLAGMLSVAMAADLFLHRGSATRPTVRRAAVETLLWTLLGVGFSAVVIVVKGATGGVDYLTGYTLEKSLSLDNVAVFAVVIAALRVPPHAERRLIDNAIMAALALRLAFIVAGISLLDHVHSVLYVFGAVLIVSGLRLFRAEHGADEAAGPPKIVGLVGRFLPPMVTALVALAVIDVVFAVDSVPAIFAVTSDAWIVCAANAFALLGMRPMYFLLAAALNRLAYLQRGLAVILVGIGGTMLVEQVVAVPVELTLGFVIAVLAVSVVWSIVTQEPTASTPSPAPTPEGVLR